MSDAEKPPIPKRSKGDVVYDIVKAGVSAIPIVGGPATELFELALAPPLTRRRDAWLESLAERLQAAEAHFGSLGEDPAFVSTVLQATQFALRTHQEEKLEALRNAVVNSAIGKAPEEDLRAFFLNLIGEFTPTHLRILRLLRDRTLTNFPLFQELIKQRQVTDQLVLDLARSGLINDPRPYAARGRETGESLLVFSWTLSPLGTQFLEFLSKK